MDAPHQLLYVTHHVQHHQHVAVLTLHAGLECGRKVSKVRVNEARIYVT